MTHTLPLIQRWRSLRHWLLLCLCCVGSLAALAAESLDTVKARMKQRLPVIDGLKAAKVIGETNNGYLLYLDPKKDVDAVVLAENQDRHIVYSIIAKQENVTPELVGKRRALKIADIAPPGTMVQTPDGGAWEEKK